MNRWHYGCCGACGKVGDVYHYNKFPQLVIGCCSTECEQEMDDLFFPSNVQELCDDDQPDLFPETLDTVESRRVLLLPDRDDDSPRPYSWSSIPCLWDALRPDSGG